jgi:hypothetical protein
VLTVLLVVVALYAVATAAGVRQGSGSGSLNGAGLPQTLGGVLVLPASSGDFAAAASSCRQARMLKVAAGQECLYRLRSGFLAKRLRLRLTSGSSLVAVLVQPKPKVVDTETLDTVHARVDLVYRQDGSTLTLSCGPDQKSGCVVVVG